MATAVEGLWDVSDAGCLCRLGRYAAGTRAWITSDEIPRAHKAFALDFDGPPLLQHKVVFQPLVDVLGHLDPPDRIGGFHP